MKKQIVAAAIACTAIYAQAQQTTLTTGGTATGTGGTATYSVGQAVYTTNASNSGSLAQGVQQAYQITVISAIETAEAITLSCVAYPNPTIDVLVLQLNEMPENALTAILSDANGKELFKLPIDATQIRFDMAQYAAANYFLRLSDSKTEIKTFKIVKQ